MSRDNVWWMDEDSVEQAEEYEEYFDVESRRWVKVPKKPTVYEENYEPPPNRQKQQAGICVEGSNIISTYPNNPAEAWSEKHEAGNYIDSEKRGEDLDGEMDSGGWISFDSDSDLLRGRGVGRKTLKPLQYTAGLKMYIATSTIMAAMLALSGRFVELGIVGVSVLIVILVSRWKGWA